MSDDIVITVTAGSYEWSTRTAADIAAAGRSAEQALADLYLSGCDWRIDFNGPVTPLAIEWALADLGVRVTRAVEHGRGVRFGGRRWQRTGDMSECFDVVAAIEDGIAADGRAVCGIVDDLRGDLVIRHKPGGRLG